MKLLRMLLWPAAVLTICVAWFIDDPYFASLRHSLWVVVLAASLGGVVLAAIASGKRRRALLALWLAAPLTLAGAKAATYWHVRNVLAAPDDVGKRLGRHFIVGYWRVEEVEPLAARGLIGGIFVTRHNIARGADALRAEIAHLQSLRRAADLPPLIVSTDQEGGLVSHLSPPLPQRPPLADLAHSPQGADEARAQGRAVGAELSALGVTMDFAPVVDLHPQAGANSLDFNSFIAQRAISDDPDTVQKIAGGFARGLAESGVAPTIKHFPGLGRVAEDTHHFRAHLTVPPEALAAHDWAPFRAILSDGKAALMVGHVVVDALDAEHPASQSSAVVDGLIRRGWGYDGLIVTDDLNMNPVFRHDICGGVVASLNAGVDLLLVSYDGRQYYPMMDCLLAAQAKGRINAAVLDRSARRLGSGVGGQSTSRD